MRGPGEFWSPVPDDGQTQAEYALLLVGVFLVVAAAVLLTGPAVQQLFQTAVDALG